MHSIPRRGGLDWWHHSHHHRRNHQHHRHRHRHHRHRHQQELYLPVNSRMPSFPINSYPQDGQTKKNLTVLMLLLPHTTLFFIIYFSFSHNFLYIFLPPFFLFAFPLHIPHFLYFLSFLLLSFPFSLLPSSLLLYFLLDEKLKRYLCC